MEVKQYQINKWRINKHILGSTYKLTQLDLQDYDRLYQSCKAEGHTFVPDPQWFGPITAHYRQRLCAMIARTVIISKQEVAPFVGCNGGC